MSRIGTIIVAIGIVLACLSMAEANGQRFALVIGNATYPSTDKKDNLFGPLTNTVNDAEDMRAVLETYGFDVMLLKNADFAQMDAAFSNLLDRLMKPGGEAGLFYFSGHGVQVNYENFLIPVGRKFRDGVDVKRGAISANATLEKMTNTPTRVQIMILDACRNNLTSKGLSIMGLAEMSAAGRAAGAIIAYAAAPGSTAQENLQKRNGYYTEALLDVLRTGGHLPLPQVFQNTHDPVFAATEGQQTPWENNGLRGGNFCFGGCGESQATFPTPRPLPAPMRKATPQATATEETAVLVLDDRKQVDWGLTQPIADLLREQGLGIRTMPVTDELMRACDQILRGEAKTFERLRLGQAAAQLVIGQKTVAFTVNQGLQGMITAEMTVKLLFVTTATGGIAKSITMTQKGVGFSNAEAEKVAIERIVTALRGKL